MIDNTAKVTRCEIDTTNPDRLAIGLVDPHEIHVFYLPKTAAVALAGQILDLTKTDDRDALRAAWETSAQTKPEIAWESGQCKP